MNVLFLDIDGVMNSHVFYENRYKKRWFNITTYFYLLKKFVKKCFNVKPTTLMNHITPDSYYTFDSQFKRLKEETCEQKWKWLSEWCNKTDTKICISSVWKNHFGRKGEMRSEKDWDKALTLFGFKPNTFVGLTGERRKLRGEEIKEWLDQHTEVTDYAILDDDSDMLENQFSKFHHCDS
jgi:hypothetical protein